MSSAWRAREVRAELGQPPAALPLAVPAATLHMAAMRGMEVVVLRPGGLRAAAPIMDKSAKPRARLGRLGQRDRRSAAALAGAQVLYAKEWGSTAHYGDAKRMPACARICRIGACARAGSPLARPGAKLMHCLPVRRNVAVADEVLDGPRAVVKREAFNRWWCRWPFCTACWLERPIVAENSL
jgi:N-acetylornithine carbamoyltransferase